MSSTRRGAQSASNAATTSAMRFLLRFSPAVNRVTSFWLAAAFAVAGRNASRAHHDPLGIGTHRQHHP